MELGVIADDFTGGTDIAGFLASGGLETVQLGGVPSQELPITAKAVVISLKSRSCPPAEAVKLSLEAVDWLQKHGCKRFFFKYCSTFDSTPQGNIGPVTDAILTRLGQDFTLLCPALPVNGRTVYFGYLFVNGVPLHESGMRNHPVNPMQDANLMRVMEAQASGKAGNIPAALLERGADALREEFVRLRSQGMRYAVTDTLNDTHLQIIAQAALGIKFVTGGSGLGGAMAALLSQGQASGKSAAFEGLPPLAGNSVILSGSCSQMTNAQVAAYAAKAPSFAVDVAKCAASPKQHAEEAAAWVLAQRSELAPLVYATAAAEQMAVIQQLYGAAQSSRVVEEFFGEIALMLQERGVCHFIVAGGETSGAVMQSLRVSAFQIGPQIAPGVPWVRALGKPLSFALKSGNFGDEQFFFKAQCLLKENI